MFDVDEAVTEILDVVKVAEAAVSGVPRRHSLYRPLGRWDEIGQTLQAIVDRHTEFGGTEVRATGVADAGPALSALGKPPRQIRARTGTRRPSRPEELVGRLRRTRAR